MKKNFLVILFAILACVINVTSCDTNNPSYNRFANTSWEYKTTAYAGGDFLLRFTANEFEFIQVFENYPEENQVVAKGTYIPDGYGKNDYCEGYKAVLTYTYKNEDILFIGGNFYPSTAFINDDKLYLVEQIYLVHVFTKVK